MATTVNIIAEIMNKAIILFSSNFFNYPPSLTRGVSPDSHSFFVIVTIFKLHKKVKISMLIHNYSSFL